MSACRRRRYWAACAALAAALAAAAFLGRWESDRADDRDARRIALVEAEVGSELVVPWLSSYRRASDLDCLIYESGGRPYALQLCFDKAGRLVEVVDRRGTSPVYSSVTDNPSQARLAVDPVRLQAVLYGVDTCGSEPSGCQTSDLGSLTVGPAL